MNRRLLFVPLCIVLLATASTASADVDFNVAAGLDVAGSFDFDDISMDADPGFTLGLELMFDVPIVEVGVGLEYGFPRDTDLGDVKAEFKHLYGIARLYFLGRLYLLARLGYQDVSFDDFPDLDDDSGGVWGAGLGLGVLKKLKVELIFNNLSSDFDYETWSVRAVYTF
jgi:hypothetical protein